MPASELDLLAITVLLAVIFIASFYVDGRYVDERIASFLKKIQRKG